MGVEAECHRCGYDWEYTGSRQYASCPNCRTSVTVGEFGQQSQQGVSSTDGISEQEFTELAERVEQHDEELQNAFEQITELQERLDEVADRSAVDGAVSEQRIAELYEAVGGVVEQLGASVEFDHAPDSAESDQSGIYDPSAEFDG